MTSTQEITNRVKEHNSWVATLQEEIAREVKRSLRIALLGGKGDRLPARVANAEAYDANLQGRYYLRRNKEALERAVPGPVPDLAAGGPDPR